MPKKKEVRKEKPMSKKDDDKLWAFLASFLTIVGFIITLIANKKSEYVKFYAKQGLVVFIASVIVGIIGAIVGWIPVLGWIIKAGLSIILLIVWIISWAHALSGEMKDTPLISQYSNRINY